METIAAIATGQGRSAIGIVRLSGDSAIDIVSRVFSPKRGGSMKEAESGRLIYGTLHDESGAVLDLCLCTVSHAPHSYTGEDTAEIQCHGSPVVLGEALTALFKAGARQAQAGEFTKRAFLNGKLDLTGAEAVIDLIDAETPAAAKNASGQLGGAIFAKAESIYAALADISSHFQAEVDFPDDDIDEFQLAAYAETTESAERQLSELYATYTKGKFMHDGVPCAIIGKPNVGKSSLLNALVGYERAIVTDIAGTTRDTVEEKCVLGGVLLRLIDTAGIRETDDTVEKIGVERAKAAAEAAELILVVTDASSPLTDEDEETIKIAENSTKPWILVENKDDLPQTASIEAANAVRISAKTGAGIEDLGEAVKARFGTGDTPAGEMLTNARQADEVRRARDAVRDALMALRDGMTPDVVLTMTEEAMSALSSLTGSSVREDIIERIFHRFCVGK